MHNTDNNLLQFPERWTPRDPTEVEILPPSPTTDRTRYVQDVTIGDVTRPVFRWFRRRSQMLRAIANSFTLSVDGRRLSILGDDHAAMCVSRGDVLDVAVLDPDPRSLRVNDVVLYVKASRSISNAAEEDELFGGLATVIYTSPRHLELRESLGRNFGVRKSAATESGGHVRIGVAGAAWEFDHLTGPAADMPREHLIVCTINLETFTAARGLCLPALRG